MKDLMASYKRAQSTLSAEKRAISILNRVITGSFEKPIRILSGRTGKIITTGVGKSGFIAMKAAATFTSLGHRAVFLNPTDAMHGDFGIVDEGDVLICFSFSGKSVELSKLLKHMRSAFVTKVISITGDGSSPIAKLSDANIAFTVVQEGCPLNLAPMASTTASLILSDCLASALTVPSDKKMKEFAQFHPSGALGLSLTKVSKIMRRGKSLPFVREAETFRKALSVMNKAGIVAVIDPNKRLIGVLTDGDVRRIIISHKSPQDLPVKELMTSNPKFINADSNLKEALRLMEDFKITSLFVADSKDTLKGIVHIHDIVENALVP